MTYHPMSSSPHQQVADSYSPPADEIEDNYQDPNTEVLEEEDDGIPKKKGRKGVPLTKRISQLTYQNKLLQDQLQQQQYQQQRHSAELQNKLQESERRLAHQEDEKLNSLQSSIKSNEEVILDQIRRAKEINDTEEEVKWQREHASLQDSKARLYAEKAVREHLKNDDDFETTSQPVAPQYNRPPIPQNPQFMNPNLVEWLEETPWANENDPNFSRDLLAEADEVSLEMNKVLRLNGQAEVIGTRDYFKTLNNIIYERYNMKDQQEESDMNYGRPIQPSHTPTAQTQSSYVGGVPRAGGGISDRHNNPNPNRGNARLSPEQEMFARNLQIPRGNGTFLAPHEARERFIKHLSNPSPADLSKPGGTPDRLTIDYGA